MAEARAIPACRARGGKYVAGSADFGRGHNRNGGAGGGVNDNGDYHGWFYAHQSHHHRYQTGQHGLFVGKAAPGSVSAPNASAAANRPPGRLP